MTCSSLEPFPARLLWWAVATSPASLPHLQWAGLPGDAVVPGEQVLRGFDEEVRHFVAAEMRKTGVDLRLNAGVLAVHRTPQGLQVNLEGGGTEMVDAVLYATAAAQRAGPGAGRVGVCQGAEGAVVVNDAYQTNVPSIYALGDVTARVQLTPVALARRWCWSTICFGPTAARPRAA